MVKIGFLVSGVNGYHLFKSLHQKCQVSFVCSYSQKGLFFDSLTPIRSICKSKKYTFGLRGVLNERVFEKADYIFVAGWQYFLKNQLEKTVIFHDSLLPKYRGFSPTVNALIQGETTIGVTAFKPKEKVDAGEIYAQAAQQIKYPIKIKEVLEVLGDCYMKTGLELLRKLEKKSLKGINQKESLATYSIWRGEEDYKIDWSWDAPKIRRFVDALGWPYEGAKTMYDSIPIRVDEVEAIGDLHFVDRHPGKIWSSGNGFPEVICGSGMIRILKARNAAGKAVVFGMLRQKLGH